MQNYGMNPALLWAQNAPTAPEAISSSHEQTATLPHSRKMIGCFYGGGDGLSNLFEGRRRGALVGFGFPDGEENGLSLIER